MECGAQADNPRASGAERERLLKMQTALLEMADTQDWLDGHSSLPRSDFEAKEQLQH
jgi:hypothetical protein